MKYLATLKYPLVTALLASFAMAAGIEDVKVVYLLPMSRGMDQFLAERLTGQSIFQVVTDPKKADAIFTDRIGSSFEASLTELYKAPEETKDAKQETVFARPAMQPLSRGKGNIFLVDRSSHAIIWSMFIEPKSNDSRELNHIANDIASKLAKARQPKK